jgi:hypothetical protein
MGWQERLGEVGTVFKVTPDGGSVETGQGMPTFQDPILVE